MLETYLARVERGLAALVPAARTRPVRLHTAMRYSLETGGKRLRPVLVLAAAELFGKKTHALPAAVAIECVHTYSLIHDDLPCMDNDDLRRGRPTAHRAFDEATALLAGDALLTHAFALLAEHYAASPVLAAALVRELADAAGSRRLIGGQMEDLLAEKKSGVTPAALEFIHLNKTAAMIEAALVMGGLVGAHSADSASSPQESSGRGANEKNLATLRRAGRHLGLAFQIVDDLLDATADTATLGKTAGKDAKAGKATFVKIHGLARARRRAEQETAAALAALKKLPGDTAFLAALTQQMQVRKR